MTATSESLSPQGSELGEGWSDSRIAAALDTSIATIERTRRQLVEEGFEAEMTQHRHGALHQSGQVLRRQLTVGYPAWKCRGWSVRDHLERGDHEEQAG